MLCRDRIHLFRCGFPLIRRCYYYFYFYCSAICTWIVIIAFTVIFVICHFVDFGLRLKSGSHAPVRYVCVQCVGNDDECVSSTLKWILSFVYLKIVFRLIVVFVCITSEHGLASTGSFSEVGFCLCTFCYSLKCNLDLCRRKFSHFVKTTQFAIIIAFCFQNGNEDNRIFVVDVRPHTQHALSRHPTAAPFSITISFCTFQKTFALNYENICLTGKQPRISITFFDRFIPISNFMDCGQERIHNDGDKFSNKFSMFCMGKWNETESQKKRT